VQVYCNSQFLALQAGETPLSYKALLHCFLPIFPTSANEIAPISLALGNLQSIVVNTKNWYREGTDLWAEFGNEMPFGSKISSKDSVKMLAVGSTPSFGRRTVCALKRKLSGIRDDVARM
jgi:hypothetical protein